MFSFFNNKQNKGGVAALLLLFLATQLFGVLYPLAPVNAVVGAVSDAAVTAAARAAYAAASVVPSGFPVQDRAVGINTFFTELEVAKTNLVHSVEKIEQKLIFSWKKTTFL